MAQIAWNKRRTRSPYTASRGRTSPWIIICVGIIAVLYLIYAFVLTEKEEGELEGLIVDSLPSSAGSLAASLFPHVPPVGEPVVMVDGEMRNNVASRVKMGVHVDWLTNTGDWETTDLYGQQHMHGYYAIRPDGKPVWKPDYYVHYKKEKDTEKRNHHAHFSFNKWRSDQLPLSMPRMDTRSPECKALAESGFYQKKKLPNTSVIFVAYNEPLSTLFRSIHSVLDRSPPELLYEIVVVDDGSNSPTFGKPLEVSCVYCVATGMKGFRKN